MFYINDELKALGERIINEKEELKHLSWDGCRIAYLFSDKVKKSHGRLVYADTEKVSDKMKALIPYDFAITFYQPNVELLYKETWDILMFHELKYVGYELDGSCHIIPHDIEDFSDIIEKYGMNWAV